MKTKLSSNPLFPTALLYKQSVRKTAALVAVMLLGQSALVNANNFTDKARLPKDAEATCVADVGSWFSGGKITANGWVKPADSLNPIFADFKNNTRCDFYKWGAQMFLWLTSGKNTRHVFNTAPVFYNVSVEVDNKRTFLSSTGPMILTVRKGKTDEEIELGQAGGGDVLISQKESLVYYGIHANDVFALYTTGQKKSAFNKDSKWISQKEDAACQAQYKSCTSEVEGLCKKQLETCRHNNFPSTPAQLKAVSKFAKKYGYPLGPEKIALAMELKTSWVDAATVVNKKDYVLSKAVVPIYDRKPKDKSGKQQWTIIGNKEKTLAMVGMHVVGTVNGHPEMVWSTFEHVNNVPDNTYTYTTKAKKKATQSYNSSGTWNFIQSNAAAPTSITANAKVSTYIGEGAECKKTGPKDNNTQCIVNVNGADISAINVFRVDPWGDDQSKPSEVISNNTDLVSINVSVLSQLKDGDIRGNYIQTGGIWTAEGQIPSNGNDKDLRGSLNLANTTMETFYQFHNDTPGAFNPKNCFGCHGSSEVKATEISHIYDAL